MVRVKWSLSLIDGVSDFNGLECLIVKENTLHNRAKGEERIRIFSFVIIFWLYTPLLWVRKTQSRSLQKIFQIAVINKTYENKNNLIFYCFTVHDVIITALIPSYAHIYTLKHQFTLTLNTLNAELNPICHLLALLGVHHFLHVSRIKVKSLTFRLLLSYIYMENLLLMF
jgi:hypothetical protein